MRGQSSLELLVTVGVVLAFTVPVIFLLISVTSVGYEDTAKSQADASARALADTMNLVYSQGPGAQREILLNVPATTESINAISETNGSEVVVSIRTASGIFDAAAPTLAQISDKPAITKKSGLLKLVVQNKNGKVELVDPTKP